MEKMVAKKAPQKNKKLTHQEPAFLLIKNPLQRINH